MNKRYAIFLLTIALIATLAGYLGTLKYEFVFDDPDQIVNNAAIRSWGSLPHYFTSDVWTVVGSKSAGSYYRPVFLSWLLLNYKIAGLNTIWWHFSSVFVHLIATLFVFLLALRMTRDEFTAGGASLLFGLHPVHLEAVAWVSGITEPLLAVLFVASFLCFLSYRERVMENRSHGAWWFVASLGFYALAVLEKETALVLPGVIIVYEWIFQSDRKEPGNGTAKLVKKLVSVVSRAVPYLLLTGVYAAARHFALRGRGIIVTPLSALTALYTLPSVLLFYIKLLVWPIGLSAFYDVPYVSAFNFPMTVLPLLALSVTAIGLYFLSRRSKVVAFFSLWMVVPLLPVLNLTVLREGEIAHDRYLYIPSIGFCILISIAIRKMCLGSARFFGQPASQFALLVVMASLLAVATVYQSRFWANQLTFSSRGYSIAPNNIMAEDNMAKELALRGKYVAAISLFRHVLERKPGFWLANFNLGYVYYKAGELAEAERYLRKAIEISPLDPAEHRFLGYTLLESGRPAEAEISLKQAIELSPNSPNQHYALGTIFKERGDLDGALVEFQQELTVNPKHPQIRQELADIEAAIGVRKK